MTRDQYQRVNHIQFQVFMRKILKSVLQVWLRTVYNSFKDKFLLLSALSARIFASLTLFIPCNQAQDHGAREKQTV